jgi:hypothetical protein
MIVDAPEALGENTRAVFGLGSEPDETAVDE